MQYKQLLEEIEKLQIGTRKELYEEAEDKIIIFRPEKLGRSLKNKNYDIAKNFQIILKKPNESEFLPNHLRVLIDVDHRIRKGGENSNTFFNNIRIIIRLNDYFFEKKSRLCKSHPSLYSRISICMDYMFYSVSEYNWSINWWIYFGAFSIICS